MARRKSMRKQRQQRRSRGGADDPKTDEPKTDEVKVEEPKTDEPKKEEPTKSFMDNLFGSDEAKAPSTEEPAAAAAAAEEAPKADEAPAEPNEEKPNALASLFGSDDKAPAAAAEAPTTETKKKRSRRRCKCYTPKKLRTVCKRMRSRRHRRSARKQKPMTYNSSNQFRDMYAVPPQAPIGF